MKVDFVLSAFRRAPRLGKRDIILTLLPALLWAGAFQARRTLIEPRCAKNPELCAHEEVFFPDRLSLGMESGRADSVSFMTQDGSGYLAAGAPALWLFGRVLAGAVMPVAGLAAVGTDLLLLVQAATWNGTICELLRLAVQRPRPFVYADPSRLGTDPAHYTSFYSGHTSFSAVAGVSLVLALVARGAPSLLVGLAASTATVLVFLTALTRVLSGRHFVTDVLAGAFFGTLVALVIGYLHRRPPPLVLPPAA